MSKTTHTLSTFAAAIGSADRLSRENSLSFHNTYTGADAAARTAMRGDWFVNYFAGLSSKPVAFVTKVLGTTLSKAAIDADYGDGAYERCSKQFGYHVVRDANKAGVASSDNAAKVVISAEARALLVQLDALYATYPEMRAVCNAYIGAAMAK